MKYLKNEADSKDAAMQIFEKLIEIILKHDIKNFKSWLHVVTKNHCLMKIRSEKNNLQKTDVYQEDSKIFMESEEQLHHQSEEERELKLSQLSKALEMLKNEQKECVNLFYIKENTYKEIVDMTGYSMKEVKSHIQNGKRNLKTHLLKMGYIWIFCWCIF